MGRLNFPDLGPATPDRDGTDTIGTNPSSPRTTAPPNVAPQSGTPAADARRTTTPQTDARPATPSETVTRQPNVPQPDAPERDLRDDVDQDQRVADDPPPTGELAKIYGRPIPDTALILARYLEHGRVPLRDPEHPQDIVTVDLPVAVHELGSSLDATCHYLHRLHATGGLTVAADGTVEFGPAVRLG